MLHRIRNPLVLKALLDGNAPGYMNRDNFDAFEWLGDERNIALRISDDLGMAQWFAPGVYEIHVWFASRGKLALDRAKAMMDELAQYGPQTAFCEPDAFRRDVNLFCRLMGFKHVRYAQRPWGRINFRARSFGERRLPETCAISESIAR